MKRQTRDRQLLSLRAQRSPAIKTSAGPPKLCGGNLSLGKDCFVAALLAMTLFFCNPVLAEDTIVSHETERHFYKDGRILKLQGQYEMTYLLNLEKDTLTRTRIYDFLNDKITSDETVYHIERQLLSHPTNSDRYALSPVVRAVGQTSADTIELLVIEDKFVETAVSTADEIVISRARRIR